MAGHSRLKDGVAAARLRSAIPVFLAVAREGVEARVEPGMTSCDMARSHL